MKFARIVYIVAAVYGFLVLLPLYFLIGEIGRSAPPPVNHAEFYYGFVGLAISWQMVFLLIARDPIRYRPVMPITILEKLVYVVPVVILYLQGKLHPSLLPLALVDPLLGTFFVLAYFQTSTSARSRERINEPVGQIRES